MIICRDEACPRFSHIWPLNAKRGLCCAGQLCPARDPHRPVEGFVRPIQLFIIVYVQYDSTTAQRSLVPVYHVLRTGGFPRDQ